MNRHSTNLAAVVLPLAIAAGRALADDAGPAPAVAVAGSMTGVVQRINADGAEQGRTRSGTTGRADVTFSAEDAGSRAIPGKLFVHLRAGRGKSLAVRPTYTSTTNSTSCIPADAAQRSFAVIAQAWYQATLPAFELTLGKMDPFAFFDQNAIADDETTRFLNNAFVHQPLLDSGGDVGADRHGFAPGARIAHVHAAAQGGTPWAASLAAFAPGAGKPFVIGQIEASPSLGGLPGTYRVYAWRKVRGEDHDDTVAVHTGIGLSADQRVAENATLFLRMGRQMAGRPRFDRAVTLGAEVEGDAWGRASDAVGAAAGWLRSGSPGVGSERIAELYYRVQVHPRVQLMADYQWIHRPAADTAAPTVRALALRARIGF